MARDTPDPRSTLPAVDDPPLTETGIVLSGFDVERLLAGLGSAAGADDPGMVALLVDRLRHGDPAALSAAIAAGARRWHAARPALAAVDPAPSVSASVRQTWRRAVRTVRAAELGADPGPAELACLAACWSRRTEIDTAAGAVVDTVPETTPV